jgi:4-amino-4-deoxy-L-arabinose transferase-like glycosyltransferase
MKIEVNPTKPERQLRTARVVCVVVGLWAMLYVMRLMGPVDLVTRSQGLSLSYLVDIITNGHWISARDFLGDPASKPPLFNWIGALSVAAFGRTWFAASLPSALAVLATALWLVFWGGGHFGWRAGAAAALGFLLSQLTVSLLPVVRPDTLFTLCVVLAAGFAFDAWRGRRSWWPFWLFATLAGLAKGPHGLVLAAAGLGAVLWCGRDDGHPIRLASLWPGLLFFLVVNLGWFGLGWWTVGDPFVEELVGEELIGHAVRNDHGYSLLTTWWQPTAYLLGRFLPWSLLLLSAVPRVVRRPADDSNQRALERFLVSWLALGLLFFSLIGHKRGDLVAPLIPAAALLVGRELAELSGAWSRFRQVAAGTVTAIVLFVAFTTYHWVIRADNTIVRLSVAQDEFARELMEKIPDGAGLIYASDGLHPERFAIPQYYYGSMQAPIPPERAVDRLAGDTHVWVVTPDVDGITRGAAARGVEVYALLSGRDGYALVSNTPHLPF